MIASKNMRLPNKLKNNEMESLNITSEKYTIADVDDGLFYWALKKNAKASDRKSQLKLAITDEDGEGLYYISTDTCKPAVSYSVISAAAGALVAGLAVFAITKMMKKRL